MVRRWVTARKSVAGPGPVIRFDVPVEVEFCIASVVARFE